MNISIDKHFLVSKADEYLDRIVYAKHHETELEAQWEAIRRSQNSPEFIYYVENQDCEIISTWQDGKKLS